MVTKVTIEFTVDNSIYKGYEEALQDFQNSLPEIDMEVKEVEE